MTQYMHAWPRNGRQRQAKTVLNVRLHYKHVLLESIHINTIRIMIRVMNIDRPETQQALKVQDVAYFNNYIETTPEVCDLVLKEPPGHGEYPV